MELSSYLFFAQHREEYVPYIYWDANMVTPHLLLRDAILYGTCHHCHFNLYKLLCYWYQILMKLLWYLSLLTIERSVSHIYTQTPIWSRHICYRETQYYMEHVITINIICVTMLMDIIFWWIYGRINFDWKCKKYATYQLISHDDGGGHGGNAKYHW